jgi:hypothetical protein
VKVGLATTGVGPNPVNTVAPDTVKDPVGRRAIAKATEQLRDVPKRERIITVGQAGESAGVEKPEQKQASVMPAKTGDIYPGEHRYAYQLQRGDTILHLGDPDPLFGRYVHVLDAEITYLNGKAVNAQITGNTETGNRVVLHMAGNGQVRLVTNQEEPYG